MSQCQVQHGSLAHTVQVHLWLAVTVCAEFGSCVAGGRCCVGRLQKHLIVTEELAVVRFIFNLEVVDSGRQRMIVVNHAHFEFLDGGVCDKTTAEALHQRRRLVRRIGFAVDNLYQRVGTVQRQPATTGLEKLLQPGLLRLARAKIAGISD